MSDLKPHLQQIKTSTDAVYNHFRLHPDSQFLARQSLQDCTNQQWILYSYISGEDDRKYFCCAIANQDDEDFSIFKNGSDPSLLTSDIYRFYINYHMKSEWIVNNKDYVLVNFAGTTIVLDRAKSVDFGKLSGVWDYFEKLEKKREKHLHA